MFTLTIPHWRSWIEGDVRAYCLLFVLTLNPSRKCHWHLQIFLCLTPDNFTCQWGTPWEWKGSTVNNNNKSVVLSLWLHNSPSIKNRRTELISLRNWTYNSYWKIHSYQQQVFLSWRPKLEHLKECQVKTHN